MRSQSYIYTGFIRYKIPEYINRDNTNQLILVRQEMNDILLKHTCYTHLRRDVELNKFKHILSIYSRDHYEILCIYNSFVRVVNGKQRFVRKLRLIISSSVIKNLKYIEISLSTTTEQINHYIANVPSK